MSHSANLYRPNPLPLFEFCDSQAIPMSQAVPNAQITAKRAVRGKQSRRSDDWNRSERQAYAKLLLSYLMNDLDVCESFLQHLSNLIDRTPQEVYIQHKKLQSEFKISHKIVTHLLKYQRGSNSHRLGGNGGCFEENAQILLEKQVQELKREESVYLQKLVTIENSLEQYEDRFNEQIEVFELNDNACDYEDSTDGSFEGEENSLEGS